MLKDTTFLHYVQYLQYWRKPNYSIFITHPNALYFLEMLQEESFRKMVGNPLMVDELHNKQFYHWKWGRLNRDLENIKIEEEVKNKEEMK